MVVHGNHVPLVVSVKLIARVTQLTSSAVDGASVQIPTAHVVVIIILVLVSDDALVRKMRDTLLLVPMYCHGVMVFPERDHDSFEIILWQVGVRYVDGEELNPVITCPAGQVIDVMF